MLNQHWLILSGILCSVSLVHSLRATLSTTLFTLFLHCIFSLSLFLTHSLCKFHFRFVVVALAFIVVLHWLTRHCLVCGGVHQHYEGGQIAVVALVIVIVVFIVVVVGHISHTHTEREFIRHAGILISLAHTHAHMCRHISQTFSQCAAKAKANRRRQFFMLPLLLPLPLAALALFLLRRFSICMTETRCCCCCCLCCCVDLAVKCGKLCRTHTLTHSHATAVKNWQ